MGLFITMDVRSAEFTRTSGDIFNRMVVLQLLIPENVCSQSSGGKIAA